MASEPFINCFQAWLVDLGGDGCPDLILVHSLLPSLPLLSVQVRRLKAIGKLSSRSLKVVLRQDFSHLQKGERKKGGVFCA